MRHYNPITGHEYLIPDCPAGHGEMEPGAPGDWRDWRCPAAGCEEHATDDRDDERS